MSATFAALTAIFARVGVDNVNSDFATLIRTIVIVSVLAAMLARPANGRVRLRCQAALPASRPLGLASGALKLGDAARVAPIDKLSVVLVAVFGVVFLSQRLSIANWVGALIAGGGDPGGERNSDLFEPAIDEERR